MGFLIPEGVLGIAALADALIILADLILLVVLLGLLWGYTHTLGAVVKFIVDHTKIPTPFGSFSIFFPLEAANNAIIAGMGQAALGLEAGVGRFFHALGVIIGWQVNLAQWGAATMEHAVSWLVHLHTPRFVKWSLHALLASALLAKVIADHIRKALTHEHKAVQAQVQPVAKAAQGAKTKANEAAKAAHAAAAVTHAIPQPKEVAKAATTAGAIAQDWPIGLKKDLTNLKRRVKAAEKWIAAGALAAAMANVLGVSARCLRSGNVGKVARRLCGLSPSALEDLLGLLADALILQNICTVITIMEDGLSLIADPLTTWLDGATAMFVHCNYDLVAPDPLALPYLPPVTGVTLYTP